MNFNLLSNNNNNNHGGGPGGGGGQLPTLRALFPNFLSQPAVRAGVPLHSINSNTNRHNQAAAQIQERLAYYGDLNIMNQNRDGRNNGDQNNNPPVVVADQEAAVQALQDCIEEQLNPEWQNHQLAEHLHRAVYTGNYNGVSRILAAYNNYRGVANQKDSLGRSLLDMAFFHGSPRMFRILIQQGGAVVTTNHLCYAARMENGIGYGILMELLQSPTVRYIINLPGHSFNGYTALQAALLMKSQSGQQQFSPIVIALLNVGADPNLVDPEGIFPLRRVLDSSEYNNNHNNNNNDDDDDFIIASQLLQAGANPNTPDPDPGIYNALHHAIAASKSLRFVRLLLENRANPNARAEQGTTPLRLAISSLQGDHARSVISALIESGGDVTLTTNRSTALHGLMLCPELGIVNLVLNNGGNNCVNIQNRLGETPLHIHAYYGQTIMAGRPQQQQQAVRDIEDGSILRALVNAGAHVDLLNNAGISALGVAAQRGNVEMVIALLQVGMADPNVGTALHVAIENLPAWASAPHGLWRIQQRSFIIDTLLQAGANPNVRNQQGKTCLHLVAAMSEGINAGILRTMITIYGGNIIAGQHGTGMTALHFAVESGCLANVQVLLLEAANAGTNITNLPRFDGKTSLHLAAAKSEAGSIRILNALIRHGGNILAAQPGTGMTPLHFAAESGSKAIVELLLEEAGNAGINITNLPRLGGKTLLHYAFARHHGDGDGEDAVNDSIAIVKAFVEEGFDLDHRDNDGMTALLHAASGMTPALRPEIPDPDLDFLFKLILEVHDPEQLVMNH